ncbi:hypothetical protein AB0305_16230, partial [Arthrobacter sp. NPDC080086]|uniref:hypothetical protein n=1 Tax=Arthrobacter sp. NPDC080086 TaxID=3155917 RepID=UPI003450F88B
HHRGGTIRQFQPINKTIGINKLGTLLSSQTTEAFEYFLKQFLLFRISSLRCLQLISFISTLQIRIFIRNSSVKVNPPSKGGSISIPSVQRRKNCFSVLGVGRHSAAATQKTLHAPLRTCKSRGGRTSGEERAGGNGGRSG